MEKLRKNGPGSSDPYVGRQDVEREAETSSDGLDPQPEKQDGSESLDEDLEAAGAAGRLVELYCEGADSEAQVLGCLSHVAEADVCSQDASAKQDALAAYIDETGDTEVCS